MTWRYAYCEQLLSVADRCRYLPRDSRPQPF